MTRISFDSSTAGRLVDEMQRGFTRLSVKKAAHGRPIAITLWHADGTGLTVQCVMHDIAERVEVGTLQFSPATAMAVGESQHPLEPDFASALKAWKLVLSTHGRTVESGVALQTRSGKEAIVMCGANPLTITVKAPGIAESFEPEYPITEYSREPVDR